MDRETTPDQHHHDDHQVAPAAPGKQQDPDGDGVSTRKPGGKDALGTKENLLAPWFDEMVEVANELAPKFKPLGLHFRPEVLLATAMQEAANKDPLKVLWVQAQQPVESGRGRAADGSGGRNEAGMPGLIRRMDNRASDGSVRNG